MENLIGYLLPKNKVFIPGGLVKVFLLILFLLSSPLEACRHKKQLYALVHKIHKIVERVENNTMNNRDPLEAAETINDLSILSLKLCDECKEFASTHAQENVEKVMAYFGLD